MKKFQEIIMFNKELKNSVYPEDVFEIKNIIHIQNGKKIYHKFTNIEINQMNDKFRKITQNPTLSVFDDKKIITILKIKLK